ncbi:MAG: hypothetical protein CMM57_00565 [Rhodospirillaceae bacterium]|nr:hypothetical protein [Rhodospirillaceae bacterium]
MKFIILCLVVLSLTTYPTGVDAQTPKDKAQELAHEGIKNLMQALRLMIEHIPQYELPVLNKNGDIIIKRKYPHEMPDKKKRGIGNDI